MPPSRDGRTVARDPRERAVWVVPLLLCAAILLIAGLAFNLAFLDTGDQSLPASPGTGAPAPNPRGILDAQTAADLLLIGIAGILLALVVFVILRRKRPHIKREPRPSSWTDLVGTLVAFVFIALFLFLWPRIASQAGSSPGSGGGNGSGANGTFVPTVSGIPIGISIVAVVFIAVLVLSFLFRTSSRLDGRRGPARPATARRSAAQAVQSAIAELEMGGDVREAILACYARFCGFLGAKGLSAQEALTPWEIEDLAVRELAVSSDSADALTALFEEARYSEHALGDSDRARAVQSLERIRADLGA